MNMDGASGIGGCSSELLPGQRSVGRSVGLHRWYTLPGTAPPRARPK